MKFWIFFVGVSSLIGFTIGFTRGASAVDDKLQEMQGRADGLESSLKACKMREQHSVDLFAPQPIGHEPMKTVCRSCN